MKGNTAFTEKGLRYQLMGGGIFCAEIQKAAVPEKYSADSSIQTVTGSSGVR